MLSGASREDVINVFCCSAEFYALGDGTNTGFVSRLYTKLLGRSADSSGLSYWASQLNAGTSRSSVVSAFLYGDEYYGNFITASYTQFLGRSPDSSGFSYFNGLMQQGTLQLAVIKQICIGDEFWTDAVSAGLLRRNP